jgi:hypothetical protein
VGVRTGWTGSRAIARADMGKEVLSVPRELNGYHYQRSCKCSMQDGARKIKHKEENQEASRVDNPIRAHATGMSKIRNQERRRLSHHKGARPATLINFYSYSIHCTSEFCKIVRP